MSISRLTFGERLRERCQAEQLALTAEIEERFWLYYELLARWNRRMNLTALPLDDFPAPTLNRLLLEPLAAAAHVDPAASSWVDLGSGGGSPAIPLAIARLSLRLTMIESKGRKSAFLREALRVTGVAGEVVADRFETLIDWPAESVDLVTTRAVAFEQVEVLITHLLSPSGQFLLFGSAAASSTRLIVQKRVPLPDGSELVIFGKSS